MQTVMRTYPVYISSQRLAALRALIVSKKESIANHGQGSNIDEVLGKDFLLELQKIHPKITGFSLNYYSCDGQTNTMVVACIALFSRFSEQWQIFDTLYKGFKIRVTSYSCGGHLPHYFAVN